MDNMRLKGICVLISVSSFSSVANSDASISRISCYFYITWNNFTYRLQNIISIALMYFYMEKKLKKKYIPVF